MIKRIIACLTICLIITGLISPVFSDASALPQPNWSDPGISEIINISDLTGWMLNGGTYDVSTYTNSEDFMNDYFNARTRTRLVSPGESAEDYYEVLPGFGINNQLVAGDSFARPLDTNRVIASSFRDHTGYGRRLSNKVNDALLSTGHLYDTKIPLLNEVEFANFVGYDHDALKLYQQIFSEAVPDNPTPNPDPNFSFITNINSLYLLKNNTSYKFFPNPELDLYTTNGSDLFPASWNTDHTLFCSNGSFSTSHVVTSGNSSNYSIQGYLPLITVNLTTQQDNSIIANYSASSLGHCLDWVSGQAWVNYNCYINNSNDFVCQFTTGRNFSFTTYFDSISNAINYLYGSFCNINLYVDGELWALASSPSNNSTITPEFPDAVGGEDLPSTTWPVHRPLAPYFITAPGMLQAIQDAIDDDGKLDIDDLKPYLTDENGDPVPDPQFDPEPVPIPVPDPVNPDIVPGLPVLPAMPPEIPSFNGVSVLAEIINFTNQSLPTSLIVTFWGVVFGIVILGLIKILHK